MSIGALSFLSPLPLFGLVLLPVIWWLLRTTPPSPTQQAFPPTRILKDLLQKETTSAHSPWWLTLIRLLIAACIIFALAKPVLNYHKSLLSTSEATSPFIVMVDNGWAAADGWDRRLLMLRRLFRDAQEQDRLVILLKTAPEVAGDYLQKLIPTDALKLLDEFKPTAFHSNRQEALKALETYMNGLTNNESPPTDLFYLSDGLSRSKPISLLTGLEALKSKGIALTILDPLDRSVVLSLTSRLGPGGTLIGVIRGPSLPIERKGNLLALSASGDVLAQVPYILKPNDTEVEVGLGLPLELRNQVAALRLQSLRSAGAVHLLDQRSHWRRVGLISNESGHLAQPLLSPLYYIERALKPFAEVLTAGKDDVATTVQSFTDKDVSVVMMADIGRLVGEPMLRLAEWVENGGVLVRFAGPHLEESQDTLLPTPLRQGGRRLGGALSWSKPQPLAAFEDNSPFAGLDVPDDVMVRRQLLADPSRLNDQVFIWARLKDGTPLVTAKPEVNGWLVLVHVTANSDWSNLPLSGLFVEMLKRLTQLSHTQLSTTDKSDKSDGSEKEANEAFDDSQTLLSPLSTLDGFGASQNPSATVESIALKSIHSMEIDHKHPPGRYGPEGQSVALNVFQDSQDLYRLDFSSLNVPVSRYSREEEQSYRTDLFVAAFLLLLLDSLIVLWMRGGFQFRLQKTVASLGIFFAFLGLAGMISFAPPLFAQDLIDNKPPLTKDLKAALNTHLAYVKTGNTKVDQTSLNGLRGLTYVLNSRTAVEPARPHGVDVVRDELAFYPILYWPVGPYTQPLEEKTIQRINAYMKQGGMIIFDTKDQSSRVGGRPGEGQAALEQLLTKLDIPRLEPVPKGHVLTKSFYLLSQFPGRYEGGKLWVEATSQPKTKTPAKTSQIDGVSTILITSNDLASAWAVNENLQPLYPVIPGRMLQREMAYRVGVNIVMYALAGNYKADQVHVPALLERLGQ